MSYALEFSERARAEFSKLDVWLQEETLDELEDLAARTSTLKRSQMSTLIHDFVRERHGIRYYVFLNTTPDPTGQALAIVSVGSHSKQIE